MKLNLAQMSRNAKFGFLVCLLGLIAAFAGRTWVEKAMAAKKGERQP